MLRKPKAKKKLGLKVPPMPMPHIELIQQYSMPEPRNKLDPFEKNQTDYTDTTGITDTTSYTDTTNTSKPIRKVSPKLLSTSPEKDFQKVPNSVTRDILSRGLFKGKSKQIYDFLWSVSRGAINPKREVRKTHKEIMSGAGIGSRNTVVNGMKHLLSIGLINFDSDVGKSQGNLYQVFAPEEIGYTSLTDTTDTTDTTGIAQKVVIPVIPLSGITGITQTQENKDTYEFPKTFFKDFKYIDDEETLAAFLKMINKLSEISEKLTGKKPTKFEADTWERLGDLLIGELLKANDKADSISNIPAFLTEVLRRKLINPKTIKNQPAKDPAKNSNDSGKAWGVIENKNNLPKEELEETLAIFLRNLREEEGFENLIFGQEQLYSTSDWQWIITELEKEGFENPLMK